MEVRQPQRKRIKHYDELGDFRASVDYIHMNPVRRKLCKTPADWRWSSARWYLAGGKVVDPLLPKIHGVPSGLFVR